MQSDSSGRRRISLTTSSIPAALPQVSAARAVSNSSSVMNSSVRKGQRKRSHQSDSYQYYQYYGGKYKLYIIVLHLLILYIIKCRASNVWKSVCRASHLPWFQLYGHVISQIVMLILFYNLLLLQRPFSGSRMGDRQLRKARDSRRSGSKCRLIKQSCCNIVKPISIRTQQQLQ